MARFLKDWEFCIIVIILHVVIQNICTLEQQKIIPRMPSPEDVPSRGSAHPHAKLSEDSVRILRTMSFVVISKAHVAELLGCSRAAIRKAVNGKNWRYLDAHLRS